MQTTSSTFGPSIRIDGDRPCCSKVKDRMVRVQEVATPPDCGRCLRGSSDPTAEAASGSTMLGGKPPGLRVVAYLVHGTVGRGSSWKDNDSKFYSALRTSLQKHYPTAGDPEIKPLMWSGKNRAKDRQAATNTLVKQVLADRDANRDKSSHYLLIGHSHGGNIATAAGRILIGGHGLAGKVRVVAVGTPFISRAFRATTAWLTWSLGLLLMMAVLVAADVTLLPKDAGLDRRFELFGWHVPYLTPRLSLLLLLFALLALFSLFLYTHRMQRKSVVGEVDSGHPLEILCLSHVDDEATSGLHMIDLLGTMAYLALHPMMIAAVGAVAYAGFAAQAGGEWCGLNLGCARPPFYQTVYGVLLWTAGCLVMLAFYLALAWRAFGVSIKDAVALLGKRVQVGATPGTGRFDMLSMTIGGQPARTMFWLNHCEILEQEETHRAIDQWLSSISDLKRRNGNPQTMQHELQ